RLAVNVATWREGKMFGTYRGHTLSQIDMATLMVGREMAALYPPKREIRTNEPMLAVRNATVPGYVHDVSFSVDKGEILGFAGMIGAGRTELFEGILGLRPASATVELNGASANIRSQRDAIDAGIGYLTEDRKGKGLLLEEQLAPNLTLSALERFHPGLLIRR